MQGSPLVVVIIIDGEVPVCCQSCLFCRRYVGITSPKRKREREIYRRGGFINYNSCCSELAVRGNRQTRDATCGSYSLYILLYLGCLDDDDDGNRRLPAVILDSGSPSPSCSRACCRRLHVLRDSVVTGVGHERDRPEITNKALVLSLGSAVSQSLARPLLFPSR